VSNSEEIHTHQHLQAAENPTSQRKQHPAKMSHHSAPSSWNIDRFRRQVESALVHVKRILENDKNPTFPSEAQHQYEDKYILVEMLSRMAISSTTNSLFALGVNERQIGELLEWSSSKSVTLRLNSTERCSFVRETKRDVDSATKHVVEGFGAKIVSKTVTTITEYFWKFRVDYELVAYRGTGSSHSEDVISILKRSRETTVMTTTENAPRSEVVVRDPLDLNISHFLHLLRNNNSSITADFSVNRNLSSCHTPRRNSEVDKLLDFYRELHGWCGSLRTYFSNCVFTMEREHGLDLTAIYRSTDVFVPVVPLMNGRRDEDADAAVGSKRGREITDDPFRVEEVEAPSTDAPEEAPRDSRIRVRRQGSHDLTSTSPLPPTGLQVHRPPAPQVVLGISEAGAFLEEERRSLDSKFGQLRTAFPLDTASATLITAGEACLLTTVCHMQEVCQHYKDGVDYVEDLLRNQLISAIGKVVKPIDFANYMRFHNRKIFLPQYQPRVFCYAVRRSLDHAPEGVVSIEDHPSDGSIAEPISTLVHSSMSSSLMSFTVNAASTISFGGERHLHTYLFHRFENDSLLSSLKLRAEARQFSSYIVLVGRITSATTFDPKYGMIVQNKDEIVIPLELETIPSAKEFKDAISSLSPEQQRFAKAFRSMQLESTLFGVCVIQIKPQLERVLNLPPDSLTKEIRLAQDLMELFITYQIPSDLVSYDGESACSVSEKVNRVKGHVSAIRDMINGSKEREIAEKRQEANYANPNVDLFGSGCRFFIFILLVLVRRGGSSELFDCAFTSPPQSSNDTMSFEVSSFLLSL
jgi:hypothetical protein